MRSARSNESRTELAGSRQGTTPIQRCEICGVSRLVATKPVRSYGRRSRKSIKTRLAAASKRRG